MMLQKSGYRSKSLSSDIALGALDGVDAAIWSYAYATIIFSGALSAFVPTGLFLILIGWASVSLFFIATSKLHTHMVAIDEQGVVIIGAIGTLLIAKMGAAAGSSEGLATMLAVMAITSLSVSAGFYLVGRLRITRLLELIPYPVVCGFMAGIAWLLLDAGVVVAVDAPISPDIWPALQEGNNLLKLAISVGGGMGLVWFTRWLDRAWALPAASLAIIGGFYAVVWASGETKETLIAGGWLFDMDMNTGEIGAVLGGLSFSDVNFGFILSAAPEIATTVFLLLLGNAIGLSVLSAIKFDAQLNTAVEMVRLSGGNLFCALVCSPPACSDEVSTIIYEDFGASSRWMPIASTAMVLAVAFMGTGLIAFMPTVLVGATIFLFALGMMNDWMYVNVRKFGPADYLIVCIILVTVIAVGFVEGILAGILLTAFMFVLRYSLISAIQGQYTLTDHRSSVERSASANMTLNRHGDEALVFTLRGYLFFGTTNAIRDAVNASIEEGGYTTILLDLRRVTGIDVSALQTFQQTKQLCEANGIALMYSDVPENAREKILAMEAVSERDGEPLFFSETDVAIERMEEIILAKHADDTTTGTVHRHLANLLENEDKARLILDLMERTEVGAGDFLFRQDDPDGGFYMLESGSLTAVIDDGDGGRMRVKKFSPGSLIGELSSYTAEKTRTASVIADEPSVLYHLNPADLADSTPGTTEARLAIHEMVARTLSARIDYMNRRLMKEMV